MRNFPFFGLIKIMMLKSMRGVSEKAIVKFDYNGVVKTYNIVYASE